ncbi:MAG TPA: efflux RND transporter periplasmic adaptor subunit [Gemmatimonadota bacterium]|jgi:RND family efflux transporter MFP subunit
MRPRFGPPESLARGAILAAVVLACGGDEPAATGAGGPGDPGGGPRTTVVETAIVETGSIAREVEVSGVVEPIRTVSVNSQLATTVRAVLVEEGDRVSTGTVLARLEDAELAVDLEAARAALEAARAAFERAEQLREREVITLPEYERERTALAAAEAAERRLETRVGYATVRSPITGVVTAKLVEAGDVVGAQTPLFEIADVSTLVVPIGVSELDVGRLSPGDTIQVSLDALPDRPLRGRIRRVFPAADPATRLVPVEVALEAGSQARPGYLARVRLRLDERQDVALVPAGAILTGAGGGESAFVVEGGKALRREIETGLVSEGRVEIVRGLSPGEAVVVAGGSSLREGSAVRIVGESTTETAADSAQGERPRS